jgi:chromosome segregation ATPase
LRRRASNKFRAKGAKRLLASNWVAKYFYLSAKIQTMWLFGKKKKEETPGGTESGEETNSDGEAQPEESEDGTPKAKKESSSSGGSTPADLAKILPEIDRIKASIESFGEVRKGLTERITRISEQIGELRAMILDRDKTIQQVELKAVKASDLVESVHPDKLMIELQKEDAKFEALKANLEGNEAIMEKIMEELKETRKKLTFFKGLDEVVKLGEEVRKELVEIKKVEASIHADTDKVATIYAELRKKFQDIDMFKDSLQEIKINLEQNSKDVDFLKTKVTGLADKSELDKLVQRVQRYIEALQELNKSSALTKDISQLKSLLEGIK